MRIIKFIVYSFLTIALMTTCGIIALMSLPAIYKNQIAHLATKEGLRYFGLDIEVGSTSLDLSTSQIVFHDVKVDVDDMKILAKQARLQYGLLNNKLKLDFSISDPVINETVIRSQLTANYLQSLNFKQITRDFDVNIHGENQQGSCNLAIQNNKINLSSCNFNFNEAAIELSGRIINNKNSLPDVKLEANFQKLKLSSYKFLKTIIRPNKTFALLDKLDVKGVMSGNLKIDMNAENWGALKRDNLSGEINFDEVKLRYDPDFPIAQNVKAKAIINGDKVECEIFSAVSEGLQVKQGKASSTLLGRDSIIDIDLNIEGQTSCVDSFINDKQKKALQTKGIIFSNVKGNLTGNVKAIIAVAEEIPTIINIKGNAQNFYLKGLAGKIDINAPKLGFTIDRKHLLIEGDGSLNKYGAALKYEQDIPYSNSIATGKIKLQTLKNAPELPITIKGIEFLHVTYTDSAKGQKLLATADLSNVSIKAPQIGFKKKKGVKCLLEINSGKSMEDMTFKIYGHPSLDIKGSFNLTLQVLNLASVNTESFQDISGKLQLAKDKISCDLSGKYANLENVDLFHLLKKKQDALSLAANIKFNKIKLKNNIEADDVDFSIKCDPKECLHGQGGASIANKKITVILDANNDSEKKWRITSQNAGMLFKALGIYSNMKNGQMDLVISTKGNIIKTVQTPKVSRGKLEIDNFTITKTPFMANFLSLLSLSPEQIFSQEIKFNKLDANFALGGNVINILDCNINGKSFDLIFKGNVNLDKREIKLNGATFPSMYGINTVLKNTPIIGKLLYSKKRKGIIFTPFNISEKY